MRDPDDAEAGCSEDVDPDVLAELADMPPGYGAGEREAELS